MSDRFLRSVLSKDEMANKLSREVSCSSRDVAINIFIRRCSHANLLLLAEPCESKKGDGRRRNLDQMDGRGNRDVL